MESRRSLIHEDDEEEPDDVVANENSGEDYEENHENGLFTQD